MSEEFDLIISNGRVVTATSTQNSDIGVRDGKIAAIETNLPKNSSGIIDASDKLVFPGFIDAHTHMGIPIMNTSSIDDFHSGSVAAAFGGVTTIIDFTIQEESQSLKDSLVARLKKAENCHVDFGLHVNVTNVSETRLHEIPSLIAAGIVNFKVFSTYRQAGMMISWPEFKQVLEVVDKNHGLLFLHAEDNDFVETLTEQHIASAKTEPIYHPRSRPAEAEARAITHAAEIAGELDARLYIVHLSSKAGLEAALKAREKGVQLILETCPQYLVLSEEYYLGENGHNWITTPPLRTKEDSEALWQAVVDGLIDIVATDHCPFTLQQKENGKRFFHLTPNGLPGVETLFPLLYTYGVTENRISLEKMVQLLAENPAKIFKLFPKKGTIQVGSDADLVIWNPNVDQVVTAENLHGNADWSPYEGFRISGKLDYTILRGQVLVHGDEFVGNKMESQFCLSKEASPKSLN